jgi:Ni/Fe-hydrogenase 1 B-type cytochrome subunit
MTQVTAPRTGTALRTSPEPVLYESKVIWQLPIRIFHWPFAASVVVLFITGLYINDPWFTAGGSTDGYLMGWVRFLHFAAAAVFCVAFAWRAAWFFLGNEYARSGIPYVWRASWWRAVFRQMWAYLRFDFSRPHLGHNALAGLSYAVFVVGLGSAQIVTGLALYGESNPGGLWDSLFGWALPLFGGSFGTHMWHHLFSWGFVVFVLLHVYIVMLDDRQYKNGLISSMISGRKFVRQDARDQGDDDE